MDTFIHSDTDRMNMDDPTNSRFSSCEIIAEAGINHNGRLDLAKELIDAAVAADADTVKFQTFNPDELVTETTAKASYQERTESENQYEMLADKTLSKAEHAELLEYCRKRDIGFLSTPYDPRSVSLLESMGVNRYKIASADIVNKPLLESVGETGKPVVLSTGMSSLGDIERAVTLLRDTGTTELTLLHCISEYPAAPRDVNLRFMKTLDAAFDVPVGFSDHTTGLAVPIAAAALGASVVEKHFTVDRSMEGPDHAASLEPDELDQMVGAVRKATEALGVGTCTRSAGERENRTVMRRSLHLREALDAGSVLEEEYLAVVRPNEGIDPWEFDNVLGRRLKTDVESDAPLTWDLIE